MRCAMKKISDFKCYFSEELIAMTVLRWIRTRYLRITKPVRQPMLLRDIVLLCHTLVEIRNDPLSVGIPWVNRYPPRQLLKSYSA